MDRWMGKIAVVTGASAGIGAAIAEKLVHEGLQVVALARRIERLEKTAKKFEGAKQGKYIPLKADISNKDDILRVFEHISKNIGPISILVNNAGVSSINTIVDGDIDKWKKVLDTNLFGLAVATREAVKSMRDNKIDGHIVNINSIVGHQVFNIPNLNVYAASKFGVTAFTETLRKELVALGSKIKTTSISPGLVATEIFEASGLTNSEEVSNMVKAFPKLSTEDVANAVTFALSTPPHVEIAELTIKPVGELF